MLCAIRRLAPAASAAATRLRVPSSRSRVALQCVGHLGGLERVGQVGELMDYDLRPDGGQELFQPGGIEDVDHGRFDSKLTQQRLLLRGTRGADYPPAIGHQKR